MMQPDPRPYGQLAQFETAEQLLEAARMIRQHGYHRVEAYTPMPVEGLAETLGLRRTGVARIVLAGGLVGAVGGYFMQYWMSAVDYPLNVGGRPYNSWPMFFPVTLETTILVAAVAGVLGMLALNRLPRPHHPLFAVDSFSRATQDGFFLCVEAKDPMFDEELTRRVLERIGAREIYDVPQ